MRNDIPFWPTVDLNKFKKRDRRTGGQTCRGTYLLVDSYVRDKM